MYLTLKQICGGKPDYKGVSPKQKKLSYLGFRRRTHHLSYCLSCQCHSIHLHTLSILIDCPSQIIMASTRGPKRAKNAFLFFCDDHRAKTRATIADAQPDLSGRELTVAVQRELGKDWTTFKTTSACAIYHERAALDKARYQREKMEGVTITVAAKRPRGRPRKGAVWNEETGAYDEAEMPPPQPRRPRGRPSSFGQRPCRN